MAGCEAAVEGMKHQDDLGVMSPAGTARRTALNFAEPRRRRRSLRGGFIFAAKVPNMATIPLTRRGAEKLKEELAR
jgi:hypothetical protein